MLDQDLQSFWIFQHSSIMDWLPIVAVPYVEVRDVLEDKRKKFDVGVDDCTMNGWAKVCSVGLLEHGWFFELNFILLFGETLKMILGITVNKNIVLLLQHFFQEVWRQDFITAAHKRGNIEIYLFLELGVVFNYHLVYLNGMLTVGNVLKNFFDS